MNPEIATDGVLQPRTPVYLDLSFLRPGEDIVNIQTYRVETKVPRRWRFWTKEHIKYNLAVLTNQHRFFIVDPDAMTVEERNNQ